MRSPRDAHAHAHVLAHGSARKKRKPSEKSLWATAKGMGTQGEEVDQ